MTPDEVKAREVLMMKNPERWPLWPWLCMKTRPKVPGDAPDFACLIDQNETLALYKDMSPGDMSWLTQAPDKVYNTPEEVHADGWWID